MPKSDVFIFTRNAALARRCTAELSPRFTVSSRLERSYRTLLDGDNAPKCVLVDWHFCPESCLLDIYEYVAIARAIPFVLIVEGRRPLVCKKHLFTRAYFANTASPPGHLASLVQTIVQRSQDGSPAETAGHARASGTTHGLTRRGAPATTCAHPTPGGNAPRPGTMPTFREQLDKIALQPEPVLLLGESGSGKSYTARYIHRHSPFCSGPFCSMNVAELSSSIAESQLFGTVRGAFTDAGNAQGLFEQANGGSIFLDEIAELNATIQSKLLDVIETRRFRRLGSMKEHTCNARLIFATNADLHSRAKRGLFRADLLYRIDVLCVTVPPLRAHTEDIPALALQFAATRKKTLSDSAVQRLMAYHWPGNIRQLANYIYRASAFASGHELTARDFDFIREEEHRYT